MKTITLVPVGGLGNRIRVIESGIRLAKVVNSMLKIIWFKDKGMGSRYDQLFCPIADENIQVIDALFTDFFYDRPRLKNFFLPYFSEKLLFDFCLYEKQTCNQLKIIDYEDISINKNIYIASFVPFYVNHKNNYYDLFKPIPELQEKIDKVVELFTCNTVGVQIRRGDNTTSTELSPTSLFIDKMNTEKDSLFYLATDSNEVKENLTNLFHERVLYQNCLLDRRSKQGIQQALIELFILSKTKKIYGSYYSSFGEVAALIGKTDFEILSTKSNLTV